MVLLSGCWASGLVKVVLQCGNCFHFGGFCFVGLAIGVQGVSVSSEILWSPLSSSNMLGGQVVGAGGTSDPSNGKGFLKVSESLFRRLLALREAAMSTLFWVYSHTYIYIFYGCIWFDV